MVRNLFLIACVILLQPAHAGELLPSIFNGKDTAGWKVPKNNQWWSVSDGVLHGKSDPKQRGSILWTENEYRNFIVEFAFQFASGNIDSGIFLRSENEQIQLGVSYSLKRDMTGSPYIASQGKYPIEAEGVADVLKQDDWNQMTIVALGDRYTVWLNGTQVLNYQSDTAAKKGPIGLQVHAGRKMEIDFRDIRVGELASSIQ